MAHEAGVLVRALYLAVGAPSPNVQPYILAIIGLVGVVLAATLPLILTRNRPAPHRPHPLNSDGFDDEDEEELRELRKKCRGQEIFLWRLRFDPNKIVTGEEDPDDIRIR